MMGEEIKRKLASIQRITEVNDIEGADAIQSYGVLGWKVVDKKDAHKVGDLVIYVSIDSWVPTELAPFLSKGHEPRVYNGVKGERLKTIKLRGSISQGLLLPLSIFKELPTQFTTYHPGGYVQFGDLEPIRLWEENTDVTEIFGIQKWEAVLSAQLQGTARGNFPGWARKTDQERCQNMFKEILGFKEEGIEFEVTMKLDGSSCSIGLSPDREYVVCSRNLSLKTDQEGNSFVDIGRKYDLENLLKTLDRPLMISGELMGPGIQNNQEKLSATEFFVFDIFDPMTSTYLGSKDRLEICNVLGLKHVPILHERITLSELNINTLDDLLKLAEGPSLFAKQREGIVFKSICGKHSFKAISNSWLLKNDN